MEDFDDDSDLAEFDKHCLQHPPEPWCGGIRPSSGRFFTSYKDFFEAQRLAHWLAHESNVPVDLSLANGEWCFSPKAHKELERLDQIQVEQSESNADQRAEQEEHWLLNEGYYRVRRAEDPSWGGDGPGKVFGETNS